jgi:hypothetical protein
MPLEDYGALIRSGMSLVPDLQAQIDEKAKLGLDRDRVAAQTMQARAQMAEVVQKLTRAQEFQRDLGAVGDNPDPTAISSLIMKYPEFADHLKQGWDLKDNAAKQADLTQLGEVYSAAASGNWPLALKQAQARVDADKAAGKADPEDQTFVDQITAAVGGDEGAKKAVLTTLGTHIAAVSGPEHFATVYGALKGGYTLDAGAARYDDNGNLITHSPFIKDADGNIRLWTDTESQPPASGTVPAPATGGFDNAVHTVLANEGGYNPKDMNGAPVNFGINAKANKAELAKLGVADIKDLTREQAIQIYRDKYWTGSGAESLPANLQTPYFDVYVRNEKVAKRALAASGGDPAKFMQLSNAYFQSLAARTNTKDTYGQAWANRDAQNAAIATGQAAPKSPLRQRAPPARRLSGSRSSFRALIRASTAR